MAALTFTKVFKAGVSLYGIGDLELLAQDTHKFEAKYLDTLVGSYSEEKEQYVKRSPINYPEKITCPTFAISRTGRQSRATESSSEYCQSN